MNRIVLALERRSLSDVQQTSTEYRGGTPAAVLMDYRLDLECLLSETETDSGPARTSADLCGHGVYGSSDFPGSDGCTHAEN